MTSDYRSTDKLNVHNEAIENMQKYSVNDNRMTSKFAIGDEIEFNSDPEDINDEKSHIYRGRIKHIKSKRNQISIALNNDCGTHAYFIDEISIKKCVIDETKDNYMSEAKQLNEVIYSLGHMLCNQDFTQCDAALNIKSVLEEYNKIINDKNEKSEYQISTAVE
eukprot:288359_1